MFGNKRNKPEEKNRAMIEQMSGKKSDLDDQLAQAEAIYKQVTPDILQVMDNNNSLVEHAVSNTEEAGRLTQRMDDFSEELAAVTENYESLKEAVEVQLEATVALVEENKHYTTPAKYLSEAPAVMKQEATAYVNKLKDMEEDGRRISVLALNAAIEAGRMGDNAKQFVAASEEIRQTAMAYEKKAADLREELEQSEKSIRELEEVVCRLISLMKDNNVSSTKLLKKAQEISRMTEESGMRNFTEDTAEIRDKVISMRNQDEEIAKCGERNRIQLKDIEEDLGSQKNILAEVESDISYMFDVLKEGL